MIVYFNGSYQPKDTVRVSPDDRAFLLGDGVYEVGRTYGGRFYALDRHLDRLKYSLQELRIGGVDLDAVRGVFEELPRRNDLAARDALVYLQVTRGAAPRTHGFPSPAVAPMKSRFSLAVYFYSESSNDYVQTKLSLMI